MHVEATHERPFVDPSTLLTDELKTRLLVFGAISVLNNSELTNTTMTEPTAETNQLPTPPRERPSFSKSTQSSRLGGLRLSSDLGVTDLEKEIRPEDEVRFNQMLEDPNVRRRTGGAFSKVATMVEGYENLSEAEKEKVRATAREEEAYSEAHKPTGADKPAVQEANNRKMIQEIIEKIHQRKSLPKPEIVTDNYVHLLQQFDEESEAGNHKAAFATLHTMFTDLGKIIKDLPESPTRRDLLKLQRWVQEKGKEYFIAHRAQIENQQPAVV